MKLYKRIKFPQKFEFDSQRNQNNDKPKTKSPIIMGKDYQKGRLSSFFALEYDFSCCVRKSAFFHDPVKSLCLQLRNRDALITILAFFQQS